jgi:hypothetical protein
MKATVVDPDGYRTPFVNVYAPVNVAEKPAFVEHFSRTALTAREQVLVLPRNRGNKGGRQEQQATGVFTGQLGN